MKRYVLRFRGSGAKPAGDVARIRALPELTVVDDSPGRMMLVEAAPQELIRLLRAMPHWVMSEEQMIPLPNVRVRTR